MMEDDLVTLKSRLARAERSIGFMWLAALLFGVTTLAVAVGRARTARPIEIAENIITRRLTVVDDTGKVLAVLGKVDRGEIKLSFFTDGENSGASFGLTSKGRPHLALRARHSDTSVRLALVGEKETPALLFTDGKGVPRLMAMLAVDDESPVLGMLDTARNPLLAITLSDERGASLFLEAEDGANTTITPDRFRARDASGRYTELRHGGLGRGQQKGMRRPKLDIEALLRSAEGHERSREVPSGTEFVRGFHGAPTNP